MSTAKDTKDPFMIVQEGQQDTIVVTLRMLLSDAAFEFRTSEELIFEIN